MVFTEKYLIWTAAQHTIVDCRKMKIAKACVKNPEKWERNYILHLSKKSFGTFHGALKMHQRGFYLEILVNQHVEILPLAIVS